MEWDIGTKRQRSLSPTSLQGLAHSTGIADCLVPRGTRDLLFSLWHVHGMPFLCPWVVH